MKAKIVSKNAKIDFFLTKWDRLVFQIINVAQVKSDQEMKDFGKMLMQIPQIVKQYVAAVFIKRATFVNSIAFMEWRKMF